MKEDGESSGDTNLSGQLRSLWRLSVCLSVHTPIICPCNVKSNHSPSVLTPFFSRLTNKLFTVQSREKRGKIIKWKHLGATFPWDALCVRSVWPETISCLTFCFVLHRDANCLHERGSGGKKPHTHTHTLSSASQSWRWKQAWTKISPLKVLLTRWLWCIHLCHHTSFICRWSLVSCEGLVPMDDV